MIGGKLLTKVLINQLAKHFKIAKLTKDLAKAKKYVEEPNECDLKVSENSGDIVVLKKLVDLNTKDIKELKKNSHAPKDFICMDCGCKAKRKK